MHNFLKCACPHCGQTIEYPSNGTGQIVPCPTCGKPITLTPAEQPQATDKVRPITEWEEWIALNERLKDRRIKSGVPLSDEPTEAQKPPETNSPPVLEYREPRPLFANLSDATIRKATKSGETPLHRAAKMGRINEIPKHLLTVELFMLRNNSGATPIHFAAKSGHLDQVPRQVLTKETMTATLGKGFYLTGSGYQAKTETPLHLAVQHANQIPKEFLTPEFLSIEAGGYQDTVLHRLAYADKLDLVSANYVNSPMWNLRNRSGQTPRDIVEMNIKRATYVARVRSELATEKQKQKLRWFGFAFSGTMTKGEAGDALDKCARDFPETNLAYYNRHATEEQLEQLKPILKRRRAKTDTSASLTYGQAKDLIRERVIENRHDDRVAEIEANQYTLHIHRLVYYRGEICPHLTIGRVKKAAKALDKISPGWIENENCEEILLQKVVELNPEWAEKEHWL